MKSLRGFTLIELLVVIAVLGVLATGLIVLINPLGQMQKTRNQIRKNTLRDVSNAIERYRIAYGKYPTTVVGWCGPAGSSWYNCGDDWIPGLVASGEIKKLPTDPRSGQVNPSSANSSCTTLPGSNYYIYVSTDGTDYKLLANCIPEGTLSSTDPFKDPIRPNRAWTVYSPGGSGY